MKKIDFSRVTIGSWITLAHPSIAEIMVQAGFDWLVVDMEHSAIELPQAQQLMQVIEPGGCIPLVRVGENSSNLIKRVMDAGAYGVIVPMVNTKDDAVIAVNAVKYPPIGTRGVGLARAQGYGMNFERYRDWVNKESMIIVQIEHIDAVDNLESIFDVDGIDGFIVGPYDLSASIGKPGEFNHPKVKSALKRIKEIGKAKGIACGFHVIPPNYKEAIKRIKEGYNFIGFSLDELFLAESCTEELKRLRESILTLRK
jgi:2-dehydro-3-deoxyglucarate aldolase